MAARKLTIYRLYFTQSDCYRAGMRQQSAGVQVHSTGANNPNLRRYVQPDDGRLGPNPNRNSHNRPGADVCASAYIGKLADGTVAVYQALPWDMRCWLSGRGNYGNANQLGYIGFEICEDRLDDPVYFQSAVMTAAVHLTAHLCLLMNTAPDAIVARYGGRDMLAVMDHAELSAGGLASGHADISHWLAVHGLSMADFRREVAAAMADGVDAEYIDALSPGDIPQEEIEVNAPYQILSPNGGYVNLRAAPDTGSASLAALAPGTVVQVITQAGEWSSVQHDALRGYVMSQYLAPVQPIPDAGDTVTLDRAAALSFWRALGDALGMN